MRVTNTTMYKVISYQTFVRYKIRKEARVEWLKINNIIPNKDNPTFVQ